MWQTAVLNLQFYEQNQVFYWFYTHNKLHDLMSDRSHAIRYYILVKNRYISTFTIQQHLLVIKTDLNVYIMFTNGIPGQQYQGIPGTQ